MPSLCPFAQGGVMPEGRSLLVVRVARWLQSLPLAWLRFFEAPVVYGIDNQRSEPQMVVLLAVPRSGSTLTYQAIIHSLQPMYLSNLGNLLFQLPLVGGWLSHLRCRKHRSDFISSQGSVSGLCGPAEGLYYWRYWLGCGVDERQSVQIDGRLLEKRARYIRRVLSVLSRPESPVVTGYLGHTLTPQRVQQTFPEAVLVRLHRDPVSNALSILRCRRKSGDEWLSLFPRECEAVIGMGEYAEVAAQVYWLNRRIDDGLNGENIFHLAYEALCQNPQRLINDLVSFCNQKGLHVKAKGKLPDAFEYKIADVECDTDAIKVRDALLELEQRYGQLQKSTLPECDRRNMTT